MKQWIKQLLIKPHSNSYKALYFINKYLYRYLLFVFVLLLAYPIFEYGYINWKIEQQQNKKMILTEDLEQQSKRLTSLQQHFQYKQQDNSPFTQINQQIKTILDTHHIKTEQWQWNLEQENQLYLSLNIRSQDLLNLLFELNQITHLYYKEVSLTKLHHAHLVQFNGVFVLSHQAEQGK